MQSKYLLFGFLLIGTSLCGMERDTSKYSRNGRLIVIADNLDDHSTLLNRLLKTTQVGAHPIQKSQTRFTKESTKVQEDLPNIEGEKQNFETEIMLMESLFIDNNLNYNDSINKKLSEILNQSQQATHNKTFDEAWRLRCCFVIKATREIVCRGFKNMKTNFGRVSRWLLEEERYNYRLALMAQYIPENIRKEIFENQINATLSPNSELQPAEQKILKILLKNIDENSKQSVRWEDLKEYVHVRDFNEQQFGNYLSNQDVKIAPLTNESTSYKPLPLEPVVTLLGLDIENNQE